jgi:hypothetical protein
MDARTSRDINAERWHTAFEKAADFSIFGEEAAGRHR